MDKLRAKLLSSNLTFVKYGPRKIQLMSQTKLDKNWVLKAMAQNFSKCSLSQFQFSIWLNDTRFKLRITKETNLPELRKTCLHIRHCPTRAALALSMPAQWLALVSRELRYSNRIFLTLPSYWNSTTHQTICNCLLLWAIRKEMFFVWSGLKRQDSQQWRIIFIDSFIQISTLCTLIVNLVFEQTFVPSSVAAKLPRQVVPPLPWWQFYSWRPGRVGGKGLTTVLVNPSLSSLLWLFRAQISA